MPDVKHAISSSSTASAGIFISQRLVASKLVPRTGAVRLLARPRLAALLSGAAEAKLVLVRAPAGFGKTTTLVAHAQWLQGCGTAVSWLTLDEADNDASRFITHLLAAFQSVDPTLALMSSGGPGASPDVAGAAADLVHHLSSQTAPFAMFLDNLEAVQNPAVLGVVRLLIDAMPVSGQMILATRETPELGLARLRAHGQLVEISVDALRFSFDESRSLLRERCQLTLSDDQLHQLLQRTQGWAAALWLAALALKERRDPAAFVLSFSGSNAAVADYLLEDVLSRQPPGIRQFLLQISVLDELEPALCGQLSGRQDSRELLDSLERAGLFLQPLAAERHSYRFHPLFRDFLYNELGRHDPSAAARLHGLAADWFLLHRQPVAALEHRVRGGDVPLAVSLLLLHAEPLLWKGRVRLLTRLLDRLPEAVAPGGSPPLKLAYAWALTFTHRYVQARQQIAELEADPDAATDGAEPMMVLRAFILAMTDQVPQALVAWEATRGRVCAESQAFLHSIQHNSFSFCLIAANRFDDARSLLAAGQVSHQRIGSSFNLAVAACLHACIDLALGQGHRAVARCREALSAATRHPGQHVSGSTIAAAFLGEALYVGDDLPEAERLLQAYLPLINEVGAPDQIITSHIVLARIAQQRGEASRAQELLEALAQLGHAQAQPRLGRSSGLERSRMALLNGDAESAERELRRLGAPESLPNADLSLHANDVDDLSLAWQRLCIHTGRAADTVAPLQAMMVAADSRQRLRRAHQCRLLLALALHRSGQAAQARQLMQAATAFAQDGGLLRSFADEGPAMLALQITAQQPLTVPEAHSPASTRPQSQGAAAPAVEPLTGREQRILALLAEGHGNKSIADRLFVSESTVKTHLRSISAKLGADNRTHAVALARRLGLLSPQ